MFGTDGHDRITVDNNVLHSRTQNRIHRNIDQFYLKELNSLYEGNDLDNSIEFNYPIELDTKLTYPSIDDYFDEEKLRQAGFSKSDIFKWSGGMEPDYEALEEEDAQALQEQENGIRNENQRYQNEITQFQNSHTSRLEELNKNLSDIDKKYANILEDYQNKLSQIEKENSTAIEKLDNEKSEIDGMKSSGQITVAEWNKKRYELDGKYYDQQDDYMQKRLSNELEYINNIASKGIEQYNISCQISDENSSFTSGMEDMKSVHETNIKNIQKTCSERRNNVYLSSNGNRGEEYRQNLIKLNDGISSSNVYPAALNIKKAIPWIPESDKTKFIEYNNRLMSDWENCRLKKISTGYYDFSKKINGMMESYEGYTPDDYSTSFKRFVSTTAIMMKQEYRQYEGRNETSTYNAIDNKFRVRFGNRTQSGHVDRILVPIICQAGGEDGIGYQYVLAEANFVKTLGENWLNRRDVEDDLHLKNTQSIDDEFKESSSTLKNDYDNDIHELEIKYKLDIDNLKYEMSSEIEEKRASFIQSVDELRINANTMAMNGKDNSGILSQISSMNTEFSNTINDITSKYDDRKLELSTKLQNDKSSRLSKYNSDLNALITQINSRKSEENNRHDDVLSQIQSDYNDAHDKFLEDAEKIRTDAQKQIQDNIDAMSKEQENQINSLNQSLAGQWNSRFPDYQVSESYDFWNNGRPSEPDTTEAMTFYIDEIVPQINSLAESQAQASSKMEDENKTIEAEAESNYVKKMAEWEEYNPNQRDLFEFNGGEYASFGDTFNTHYEENYGGVRCDLNSFGWIYVHYNYGAETGQEFPDYEKIDA